MIVTGFFAFLLANSPSAAEALPYAHVFGNTTSSGCASQWNGDCEIGFGAVGAADKLGSVHNTDDTSCDAVMIVPGTGSVNGTSVVVDVSGLSSGDRLQTQFDLTVVGFGTLDFHAQAIFKNSGGATISTQTKSFDDMEAVGTYAAEFSVPSGASTATIVYAADDASSGSIRAVLGVSADPGDQSCLDGGISIFEPTALQWCGEWSGDCDCNISCPEGSTVYHECDSEGPPACIKINVCMCLENEGECDSGGLMDQSNWGF